MTSRVGPQSTPVSVSRLGCALRQAAELVEDPIYLATCMQAAQGLAEIASGYDSHRSVDECAFVSDALTTLKYILEVVHARGALGREAAKEAGMQSDLAAVVEKYKTHPPDWLKDFQFSLVKRKVALQAMLAHKYL